MWRWIEMSRTRSGHRYLAICWLIDQHTHQNTLHSHGKDISMEICSEIQWMVCEDLSCRSSVSLFQWRPSSLEAHNSQTHREHTKVFQNTLLHILEGCLKGDIGRETENSHAKDVTKRCGMGKGRTLQMKFDAQHCLCKIINTCSWRTIKSCLDIQKQIYISGITRRAWLK